MLEDGHLAMNCLVQGRAGAGYHPGQDDRGGSHRGFRPPSPSRNPAARQPRAHRLGPAPPRLTAPSSAEDDSQAEAFASSAQPIQVLPGDYPTRETFAPGLLRGVPLPNALKINQFFESLSDPLSCCFAISKLTNSLHPPRNPKKYYGDAVSQSIFCGARGIGRFHIRFCFGFLTIAVLLSR